MDAKHTPSSDLARGRRASGSRLFGLLALSLALPACGRDAEPTPVKFAGVGLNPDDIGPYPVNYGGMVEYDWVDFAGANLPLGLIGLVSYDGVGPDMIGFKPPYALINGTGFIFETDTPMPDTLFGNFGVAPSQLGSCYTSYEPTSYLSSIANVGDAITFDSNESDASFAIGRRPNLYGPHVDTIFPYYSELSPWVPVAATHFVVPDGATQLADLTEEVLFPVNYGFGEEHRMSFPGNIPQEEATFGSIPMPLAAAGGDQTIRLPNRPQGVQMSWKGPVYGAHGELLADGSTDWSTCLRFRAEETSPVSPEDCLVATDPKSDEYTFDGQMYTGPWETSDGVTLDWIPSDSGVDENIIIAVRFLGPVDENNEYMVEGVIPVASDKTSDKAWGDDIDDGLIPQGTDIAQGYREQLPCDDDEEVEWIFDRTLKDHEGNYVPSLQGDPNYNLAEVVCSVPDSDGTFTITEEMVADALTYARSKGGGGAIFYFDRATYTEIQSPPVRDRYGNKRVISPIRVVANAAQIGRFWYE